MTKQELQAKYPKCRLHHEPLPTCRRCGGTGEVPGKTIKSGTVLGAGPCICVFVQHDMIEEVASGLARVCRDMMSK